jgi:hypothetical protein
MNFEKIPGIFALFASICFILGLVLCALLADLGFTVGFAAGGALMVVNLFFSTNRVKNTGFSSKGAAMASLLGGFYVRLIILSILLFALIRHAEINALGLVAGLSIVPAALIMMIIMIYLANRGPEEV